MKENKIKDKKVLKGFYRNQYDKRIAVYCPTCKKWHQHGRGEGARVTHCTPRKLNPYNGKIEIISNYDSNEYIIKVFTKTELKPYKEHILDLVLTDKEKQVLKLLKVGL